MNAIHRAVSLYSLQEQYARQGKTVDQLFDFVEGLGCEGVEFISDQMMYNTPCPDEETLRAWDRTLASHHLKPVCNDVFINTNIYKNRNMTRAEATGALVKEIQLADRLGFSLIRLVSETPREIIEPALPAAERYHVCMAMEIHGGLSFSSLASMGYIQIMKELNSPYLGLVMDMSMFCRKHPRVSINYFSALGPLNPEVVKYVDAIFAAGSDPVRFLGSMGRDLPAEAQKLIKSENDALYLAFSHGYENHPLSMLDDLLPYIVHIHGKFYEMTDEGVEYSIPYGEIVKYLSEKNWSGYIASEYEGQRFVPMDGKIDECDQVMRHQALLKKLIGR
jgi:sugar phosphate isomerase/epimerase